MKFIYTLILGLLFQTLGAQSIQGAWTIEVDNLKKTMILTDNFLTIAEYKDNEFVVTWGGTYELDEDQLILNVEFNSSGNSWEFEQKGFLVSLSSDQLSFDGQRWSRIDNGQPGALFGAWIITGREVNGEMTSRSPSKSRKTMKVLSGTRFQWIAYDIDSKSFMGTGGGTYTTTDGKYTENIDFFSRDNSRVGASLEFDFERKNNDWHHSGLSSKGKPINEVWSIRE